MQHEIEINNMIDKLNLTRDTNIQKLKHDLKFSAQNQPVTSRAQVRCPPLNVQILHQHFRLLFRLLVKLNRLQELEEVTVEQDNAISALNQKVKHLNTECDSWKARFELQIKQHEQDLAK